MEQFTFKSGNAAIRHLKELPKPKKKMNTDRLLFIILLICVSIYFGYKLYKGIAVVEVDGMVTMDKLSVEFTDDVRVLSYKIEEGVEIERGDTLFTYMNQYFEDDAANYVSSVSNIERITREELELQRKLSEKRAERNIHQKKLTEERFELERVRDLVTLAVYTRTQFEDQNTKVANTLAKIELVKEEIKYLIRHLDQLKKLKKQYEVAAKGNSNREIEKLYIAPSDGVIGKISIAENEVCYEKEEVLTIHQPSNIRIQAYFSQKVLEQVRVGEIVNVQFPDGSKQKGIIDKYYVSTYELPPEFQKKYEPTERGILVDISPLNKEDVEGWKQFYKMSVKVSTGRFF